MAAATLTDFEFRVLRYLERSRQLARVWVSHRTITGAADTGAIHVLRALDRLCELGLAVEDRRPESRVYAVTELGATELRRRSQLALEIEAA